jgi:HlyD family secretion protein
MKLSVRWVVLPVGLAALVGFGFLRSRPPLVAVAHPVFQQVVQSVAATGTVIGVDESDVGAELSGRLASLLVKEGDLVRKGQQLAQLETRLLKTQLEQARAALTTAEAQLAQASRGPLPSEVARTQAEVQQARKVAEGQLVASQQKLLEVENGPTREELEQARGQALQAEAQRDQARRESKRLQGLYDEGFVTLQELERAKTQEKQAQDGYITSYNRYRQSQIGNRREVRSQAQAALAQAQASLAGAQQTGSARLQNLEDQPRSEDVQVAQARLEEAKLNLKAAEERLRQADIRAPYDGTVTKVFIKAGQLTGANAPVLHLVRGGSYQISVNVDESNLSRLKLGLPAVVSSDSYGENFPAKIEEIAPQVISERGTVQLKLKPEKGPSWLRPGLTVSANLLFDKGQERPVVPLTAVTVAGRRSTLLVLQDGKLVEREVQLGGAGREGFPVMVGLEREDWVVQNRTGLIAGQKARR